MIIGSEGLRRRFFAEACNLQRYLNTLLFLIHVTNADESIAFNRIGSHPLANAFGLIRMQSKNRHEWGKMLRVLARGCIVDEILVANGLRSHVVRELAIAGATTYPGISGFDLSEEYAHGLLGCGEFCMCWIVRRELRDEDGEEAVKDSREEENDLEDWCAPGSSEIVSHDWWRDAAAITEQEEDEMRKSFSEIVKNMAEMGRAHTPKVHHSGSVANQGMLSRLIAFKTEERAFYWIRKMKAVAWQMHNERNQTPGTISEALGCSVGDVLLFFSSQMPLVVERIVDLESFQTSYWRLWAPKRQQTVE
jgi:hypothetical protein